MTPATLSVPPDTPVSEARRLIDRRRGRLVLEHHGTDAVLGLAVAGGPYVQDKAPERPTAPAGAPVCGCPPSEPR